MDGSFRDFEKVSQDGLTCKRIIRKMKVLIDKKLITCIIPKDKAIAVAKLLHEEKGINTANVSSGRGRGVVEPVNFSGWYEVEILTVVVSQGEADEIFNFIYDEADVGRARGGLYTRAD